MSSISFSDRSQMPRPVRMATTGPSPLGQCAVLTLSTLTTSPGFFATMTQSLIVQVPVAYHALRRPQTGAGQTVVSARGQNSSYLVYVLIKRCRK